MIDWIIETKLTPPPSLPSMLVRDLLIRKLMTSRQLRAVILHAPAGFGKTALLVDWRRTLLELPVPVAWLSLDDSDRDPLHFLMYITAACKSGGLIPKDDPYYPSDSLSASPASAHVESLLTRLCKTSEAGVIVIDDYHRATSPENSLVLNHLLSRLPKNIQLVISTREYPSTLALADLREHEALLEIGQSSLRFSESEICTYLSALIGPIAQTDWPGELFERTEGWPIALNAVRRWVLEGASFDETLAQISGRSSDLSDYFLEQVFDALDKATQEFLLKTSILERVNGDLANLLCGCNNGWEILEDLERRDLFVQSLDRERQWYRYHRLFSEFLHERMRRRLDKESSDLHTVASTWFKEHQFEAEAVHHALASDCHIVIAELFESLGGWHYGLRGHLGVLEKAVSVLRDDQPAMYPRLCLAKVHLALRRGDIEFAEKSHTLLTRALEEEGSLDAELRSELLIMRSYLNAYAGNVFSDEEITTLETLAEVFPSDNDLMHAVRCNSLCVMYARRGDFDQCVAVGDRAIRHFRKIGSVFGETFVYFHEGYASMVQGRLRDAEALYEAGHELALEHFGVDSDLDAIASSFLAEAAYEANNLHRASQLLKAALPHIERFDAWLEVYIAAYTTAMKLATTSFGFLSLSEIRDRARSTASSRGIPRLREVIDLQAELLEPSMQPVVSANMANCNAVHSTLDHPVLRQLRVMVSSRAFIANSNDSAAIELLERERDSCTARKLLRSCVSYSILLTVAYRNVGRYDESGAAFGSALSASLFEGVKRPFIDEGLVLVEFLKELTEDSEQRRGNRLRDRFIVELMMEINADISITDKGPDALSAREREVLRYLVQGRSNREIGETISLSINTIKFHIKNLFEKLNVSNRKDAVSASIRRGLS